LRALGVAHALLLLHDLEAGEVLEMRRHHLEVLEAREGDEIVPRTRRDDGADRILDDREVTVAVLVVRRGLVEDEDPPPRAREGRGEGAELRLVAREAEHVAVELEGLERRRDGDRPGAGADPPAELARGVLAEDLERAACGRAAPEEVAPLV